MLALVFRSMIRSRVVCCVATLLAILWVLFIFHRFYNVDPFRQKLMYGSLAGLTAAVWLAMAPRVSGAPIFFWHWVPFPLFAVGVLLVVQPLSAAAAIVLAIAAFAAGRTFFRWANVPALPALATSVHLLAVGVTLCSIAILGVGLLHGLNSTVLWMLGIMTAVVAGVRHGVFVKTMNAGQAAVRHLQHLSGLGWVAVWFITVLLGIFLVKSISPPLLSDDLVYHVGLPAIFARAGQVFNVPFYTHFNAPLGAEMLYTAGIAMGSEYVVTGLVNFGYVCLLLGAFVIMGRRLGGGAVGLFAWIAFFSIPYYTVIAASGSADLKHLLYFILAIDAYLLWRVNKETGYLVLCAAEAGFALNYRYHGIILGSALLIGIGWTYREKKCASSLRALGLFCAIFALAGSPWLVRNWIETGNPLFPTSTSFFNGFRGDPELSEIWRSYGNPASPWLFGSYGFGVGWYNYFSLPWRVTFLGGGFEGYEFTPIYLGLVPLSVWFIVRRRLITFLAALGLFYTSAWFVQMHQLKFLMPVFALFALVTVGAVYSWGREQGRLQSAFLIAAVLAPVVCTLSVFWVYWSGDLRDALHVALKPSLRDEYLERRLPLYPMLRHINSDRSLPEDFKVFTWEDQGLFYLRRDFILGHPQNQVLVDYRTMPDFQSLLARLKELGVTHLLFHPGQKPPVDHLVGAPHAALALLLQSVNYDLLRAVHRQGELVLYEIEYPANLAPYDPAQHADRVAIGDILMDYGMLDRARQQYALAGSVGAQKRESIDGMNHYTRGNFYFMKARAHRHPMFLKPALDEFAAAVGTANSEREKAEANAGMQEIRSFANQLVGHIWGRLPATKWLVTPARS